MREGSPSRTAIVVAKSQALIGASRSPDLYLDPAANAFARRALEIAGHGNFVRALRFRAFRRALRFYESLMILGLARHHVLRKQFIERKVREALQAGIRQVIQIGAGLDSLCYRLHRDWPRVRFSEWDHPATQAVKQRVLDTLGIGNNFRLRPLDLGAMNSETFRPIPGNRPTVVVVEGVLMYLPPKHVARCLQTWRRACHENSRLLFTFMEGPGFRNQSPAVNAWLRLAGEPFLWHANPKSVRNLLRKTGWKLSKVHAPWQEKNSLGAAAGEWIAEATAIHTKNPEAGRLRFNPVESATGPS